ncbi:MAG TPA: sugar ABC transporter permease [Candidatus Limnocylindrales bacterium]|jgi:alpha-glucoside transport system permease protein|nr:sugar ABC transporter permease [Candidatus Limnocylindrales bacterium]
MEDRLITAAIVLLGVPAALVGYILVTERLIQALPERRQGRLRPWFWIAPALAFLIVFLIYPTINTLVLSFQDKFSRNFVGLDNYIWFFGDPGTLEALRNSVLWVVFMTGGVVGLGLLVAILVDRVRYEPVAKTAIFVPLAISFVAAAIIWQFMYQYRPPGTPQIGTVNSVLGLVGLGPVDWIRERSFLVDNFALIFIGVWMWTGFAMVILSAGLKGISTELLEAARVDGANEWQVFRGIILPLLMPTIFVVGTTIVITALKSFDIIYTLTNGAFGTDVIARKMFAEMFTTQHFGRASAVAIVLLLAIIPFMAVNIRRFREQEALR